MANKKLELHEDYAVKIMDHLQEMFDENSESTHKIDLAELADDPKKATAFIHALANIAPTVIYQKLTGEETDMIGFNHTANRLVFQFTK